MHMHSKALPRMAIVFLAMLLLLGLYLAVGSRTNQASALSSSEWAAVAGAIDSYINAQYSPADDGEAGFLLDGGPWTGTGTTLKDRIDSNNDGVILGEGDDAANAPVLVDVYSPFSTFIPGTNYRLSGSWRTGANNINAPAVKAKVQAHRDAGFSDTIVTYCVTGHTESPNAMAYGAMAHAGYFGSPTPTVVDLKWGRLGWGGSAGNPGYTNAKNYTTSPAAATANPLASLSGCSDPDPAEVVRCAADTGMAGVGITAPWAASSDPQYQVVDLRSSFVNTMADQTSGNPYAIQDPLLTLFDATGGTYNNLAMLDSSGGKTIVFVNRTQHTEGMAAQGARMLGYQANFLRWGLPAWNGGSPPAWPEKFVLSARGYDYAMASGTVDTTAPTISGITASPCCSGATISWTTDEPATSKVEWSTTSGGPYTTVNDTVLHTNHSVTLSGLPDGSTIYYRVSSYDGVANGTTSAEGSFTTPTNGKPSPLMLSHSAYWASYADYTSGLLSVDYTVTNNGNDTAYNVKLTGSSTNNGVTLSSGLPATIGNLGGGGGAGSATVVYSVPTGVGSFTANITGSAEDGCGHVYTYPPE